MKKTLLSVIAIAVWLGASFTNAPPASALSEDTYTPPNYSSQFEAIENQCSNTGYGGTALVSCWTENGTDMLVRIQVAQERLRNTTRLKVQRTSALEVSQGTVEGRDSTLEPAGYSADGLPYFLFSFDKWATSGFGVTFLPTNSMMSINFNVNRGSLNSPVVLRNADTKQGNFWRLSEPLAVKDQTVDGVGRRISLQARTEDPLDVDRISALTIARADPETLLFDGAPTSSTTAGASGRHAVGNSVECPSEACVVVQDPHDGRISWEVSIPKTWDRVQYLMEVTGKEAAFPYRDRRPYQGQLATAMPPIPVPEVPVVDDPCGAGNASWMVPEDSAELAWKLGSAEGLIDSCPFA